MAEREKHEPIRWVARTDATSYPAAGIRPPSLSVALVRHLSTDILVVPRWLGQAGAADLSLHCTRLVPCA